MRDHLLGLLARVELQLLWRWLHRLALAGMGYLNANARTNGEDLALRRWAAWHGARRARERGPPAVVFDIGANKGDFAARVAELLPDAAIHCFEPGAEAFARLAQRFAGTPRVVLNQVAVAERDGTATLYDYAATPGSAHASLLPETFRDIYPAPAEGAEVPATALDAYAASRSIDRIDYLKIDVEGAERGVLEGARGLIVERRVDHVQFEFNAHAALTGLTLLALSRLLAGYDLYRIVANGRVPVVTSSVRYNTRIEVYKYANFLAVRQGLARAP